VIQFLAGYLMREPPSLAALWAQHRKAASFWLPPPATGPVPRKPGPEPEQPQLAWTGEGLALAPAAPPVRRRRGGHPWLYRARLAWGLLHCAIGALIYLAYWATEKPVRALITAALVWLVFWVLV
jgi:hypothetical protein